MTTTGGDEEPAGFVDDDGTWSDRKSDRDAVSPPDIAYRDELEAKKRAAKHFRDMQRTIIYGLGGLVVGVFLATLLTLAAGGIQESFAQTVIQAIIAPLIAALGVVVGYFFGDKKD